MNQDIRNFWTQLDRVSKGPQGNYCFFMDIQEEANSIRDLHNLKTQIFPASFQNGFVSDFLIDQ